jgi:Zn-dependent metalloprotease
VETHQGLAKGNEREEVNAARRYLGQFIQLYQLEEQDVNTASVTSVHNTGRGAIIVRLRQRVGGIDVFRDELRVVMNREMDLIALSGFIPSARLGIAGTYHFSREDAVAAAFADLTGRNLDPRALSRLQAEGGYSLHTISQATEQSPDGILEDSYPQQTCALSPPRRARPRLLRGLRAGE